MEDPESESEWRIEPFFSKEDEDKDEDEDEEGGIVKWMLNTGKKMAVTGIMISSAPLVIPPLAVFSAIGVAFSVPFGILFAGYACTNKIMTILLPTPTPPPLSLMLQYYETDNYAVKENQDEVECYNIEQIVDDGIALGDNKRLVFVKENEDSYGAQVEDDNTEKIDDMNDGVEAEIALDDDYRQVERALIDEDVDEIRKMQVQDDMFQKEKVNEGEDMEEDALEGDDDSLQEELNANEKEILVEIPIEETSSRVKEDDVVGESGSDKNVEKTKSEIDSERLVQVGSENDMPNVILAERNGTEIDFNMRQSDPVATDDDILDGEEKEREQMEQGYFTKPNFDLVGDYSLEVEEPLVNENKNEPDPDVNEDAKLKDNGKVDNTDEDDYVATESGLKEVEINKPVTVIEIDSKKVVEAGSKNDEPVGEVRHVVILSKGSDENNFNSREIEELDLVAREVMGDSSRDERNIESDEKVMQEMIGSLEIAGGNTSKEGREDGMRKEHLIQALEIGDGQRKKNVNFESLEVGSEAKENENAGDENMDVVVHSPSKQAPLDAGNAEDASKTNKKMPSSKENLDDEQVWEKIRAMRTIVGYKAPPQPTCIGELKALYVFTGVEPPASSLGDSDLDEVNAKLKFLMAIIGVK